MFSSHVRLQEPFLLPKVALQWLKELVLRPEKKLGAKGSQPNSHATSFFVTFVEEMLSFNVNLQGIFILKVSLHRLQEECSPLQQPCKQYLSAGRARPARKSPGGKKTRLQSSIRTNARKCLPARQETLQNRQKRRPSRGRQATKQKTNCS